MNDVPADAAFAPANANAAVPPALRAAALSHGPLAHGFFTRAGGVSTGLYGSLNCGPGSGDAADAVAENRARVAAAVGLGPERLTSAWQVHGAEVATLAEPIPLAGRPKVDGFVTDRPGIALGILTADCVPVLFADAEAGVIGAAHAGWKGALAGIVGSTVEAMVRLGARRERIAAAIGPAIRQPSYEVGLDLFRMFTDAAPGNHGFFAPSMRARHFQFDLTGFVAGRLAEAEIATIEDTAADTRADAERFFSYRRSTLAGEGDYGRQLSVITLLG
jgi:YfiH family protein